MRECRVAAMSVASLRAGTMTVMEGEPAGEMLCCGRSRLGMRGRPKAAAMTFHSQVRAISQAMIWTAICMEEINCSALFLMWWRSRQNAGVLRCAQNDTRFVL